MLTRNLQIHENKFIQSNNKKKQLQFLPTIPHFPPKEIEINQSSKTLNAFKMTSLF